MYKRDSQSNLKIFKCWLYKITSWGTRFAWKLNFRLKSQPSQLNVFKPNSKTLSCVYQVHPSKFEANRSGGFWVMVGDYYFTYVDRFSTFRKNLDRKLRSLSTFVQTNTSLKSSLEPLVSGLESIWKQIKFLTNLFEGILTLLNIFVLSLNFWIQSNFVLCTLRVCHR